jgi:hypothetical protein
MIDKKAYLFIYDEDLVFFFAPTASLYAFLFTNKSEAFEVRRKAFAFLAQRNFVPFVAKNIVFVHQHTLPFRARLLIIARLYIL